MSADNKCGSCGKTVYPMERFGGTTYAGKVWHKACFRCMSENPKCSITLDQKTFNASGGKIYCKAHVPKHQAKQVADTVAMKTALNAPKKVSESTGTAQKGDQNKLKVAAAAAPKAETGTNQAAPAKPAAPAAAEPAPAEAPAAAEPAPAEAPAAAEPAPAEAAPAEPAPAEAAPAEAAPAEAAPAEAAPAEAAPAEAAPAEAPAEAAPAEAPADAPAEAPAEAPPADG